ncbi:MAG: carboxynorspermidine decarboxylase [Deltaproteobacteria bacterium]|nr:carboxynorspermidine decarboxylase [Deltaproteobacteria bacterium]
MVESDLTPWHVAEMSRFAPSPAFVIDLGRLRSNLAILEEVRRRSDARILLALKAFAMWRLFPLLRESLDGVCASSPWEAQLGCDKFGGAVHSFAAALRETDVRELLEVSSHLSFNSFQQLERFRSLWEEKKGQVSIGLRVNPEHSEGATPLYDPCAPKSRLGVRREDFTGRSLDGVEGLHFHTLCEQLFEPLKRTAVVFEEKFGEFLAGMKWLNLGGGHHITRRGYDIEGLVTLICHFQDRYGVQVYLEPGEAVVLGSGILVSEVLDVVRNGMEIAILDVSATCHMPDVLEMPYRPDIEGGFPPGEKPWTYRLAGPSCLAGDVIGDWSFEKPLNPGDRLAFLDMAHYTMVKTTTFNGIRHPHLCVFEPDTGKLEVLRSFDYRDFRDRLS